MSKKNKIKRRVLGTPERPRLFCIKSDRYLYAQIVDDISGKTLLTLTTAQKKLSVANNGKKNVSAAISLGEMVAKKALEKGIKKVVFDRRNYKYHGKIKALADTARKHGLEF